VSGKQAAGSKTKAGGPASDFRDACNFVCDFRVIPGEAMNDSMQPRACTDLMRERLRNKVDDVIRAFDRDMGRRNALRDKLFGADPEVLLAAIDCFGSAEAAALWLTSPEVGLANENPLDVADSPDGKERVLQLLWRLNLGMFACAGPD
jgi:Protein of unknown function (DUF2384)